MNNQQRTITSLLTIVAVLLTADIAVRLTDRADAQPGEIEFIPVVRLVGVTVEDNAAGQFVYRAWSDGTVEVNSHPTWASCTSGNSWCGWRVVPE